MTKHIIADRLGYYDEKGQYVTHRTLTKKPPVSFSKRVRRAWRIANKPRELVGPVSFHNWKALGMILLIGLGILFTADQVWKGAVGVSPIPIIDPDTIIWEDEIVSADLSGYNSQLASLITTSASACSGSGLVCRSIQLNSNSTHAAIALSKNSIGDLGIIAGKEMYIHMMWNLNTTAGCCGMQWGYYLTRNATLPLTASYNPVDDKSVALFFRVVPGAGTFEHTLFLQRDPIIPVSTNQLSCSQTGSCFIDTTSGSLTTDQHYAHVQHLNFTGTAAGTAGSPSGNNGRSWLKVGDISGFAEPTNFNFPWLRFQGETYYLGFWEQAGGTNKVQWFASGSIAGVGPIPASMVIAQTLPTASAPSPPSPVLEGGGFFGPLIRALIGIGIWILNGIAQFFGFVANAFVTAMDAVGAFFGLGAIGTAIRDALVGVGTWITNVFGTIFGQAINIATAIANALSAAVQVTGTYWTRLTSWLSAMSDLLSLFWPFIAFFGVGLPFSALMTYWLIQGIIMSYNSRDGALQWMRWTWILSATLFNIMWAIGERAFDVILKTKQLLAQWL